MKKQFYFDDRREIFIPGDREAFIDYCAKHWLEIAKESIKEHGFFAVALSGGTTPKLIFERLSVEKNTLPWEKVFLFWSDERAVPPEDAESNFRTAMVEGKLNQLPIPKENIFRMKAEADIEKNAREYEEIIEKKLQGHPFDLIMLGMGEDGHTASLFPHTEALHVVNCLVAPNFVPQKNTYRMSFTFECINRGRHIVMYLMGKGKADIVTQVLNSPFSPDEFPSQRVGTPKNPALLIMDDEASSKLLTLLK
jgi:6-phosphogluconolactonase